MLQVARELTHTGDMFIKLIHCHRGMPTLLYKYVSNEPEGSKCPMNRILSRQQLRTLLLAKTMHFKKTCIDFLEAKRGCRKTKISSLSPDLGARPVSHCLYWWRHEMQA